ncbi:iron-containing alcohol dehydrogenase [Desulforhopalus singaporensis]|uniref:Iron-containing alcohol dehydrogenase n=1 Tax=Desulforhopalus singaporensis TaxID=91360 RepID=A0A1H0VM65_9BACT|nr:iron-containing alcohol dehydrogenase [Desulforhopalus singaporensis]SDP79672.1 Iron-containing alcohol dehydrogenase [Desulforhopalus singaporensis]
MILFNSENTRTCLSPSHVLYGDGAAKQVADILTARQISQGNLLIVADQEVVKLGLIEQIMEPLKEADFNVDFFSDIVGEPTLEVANALVDTSRSKPYEAVIGVGGGSALDMSKLAAALAVNDGAVTDYLGPTRFPINPLPLINVPTTAGTGAEATAVSMLAIEGKKAIVFSSQLVPMGVVLDPLMTMTLPPHVTAATGLDALSHGLEAFMSLNASPFTDSQAIITISTVIQWLKTAYNEGDNLNARRAMAYAAYTGGLSLNAGVVLGHSVAYTISNRAKMPHGVSCAMALPYTIAFNLQECSEKLQSLANLVLGESENGVPKLIDKVSSLVAELGIPLSLKEIGLQENDLGGMVEECLSKYPRPTNPSPITRERLEKFYSFMYDGDVDQCCSYFGG